MHWGEFFAYAFVISIKKDVHPVKVTLAKFDDTWKPVLMTALLYCRIRIFADIFESASCMAAGRGTYG